MRALTVSAVAIVTMAQGAVAQTPVQTEVYTEEWVYRIKYGYQDEWWQLFQKYEVPELDAFRRTGEVVSYAVYRANLHTDEASRWDFRVIVNYRNIAATSQLRGREAAVQKSLFPDAAAHERGTKRRWELTLNHWDLPIGEIDPHK